MKKILSIILIAGICAAAMLPIMSEAQTSTNSIASFPAQVESYFTSFNTNYNWNVSLEAATGYKQVTGQDAATFATVQYDISTNWDAGVSLTYAGVGSSVDTLEASAGYTIVNHFDTKLEFDLGAGYDWNTTAFIVEPGLVAKKKMTPNTYIEIGISLPIETRGAFSRNPTFITGAGFTF